MSDVQDRIRGTQFDRKQILDKMNTVFTESKITLQTATLFKTVCLHLQMLS